MKAPQGRCYWAVAPFSPTPPYRLYAGRDHRPIEASTLELVEVARKGEAQVTALVEVKARPVLVISPVLEPYDEVLALRLRTFDKLSTDERQRVRDHKDDGLFHLEPRSFTRLPQENAAIVTAMLRLPLTALDTRVEQGALNVNELRVVHERLARAHHLNLDMLALSQAQRLIERMRQTET